MSSALCSINDIENEMKRVKESFDDQILNFKLSELKRKCFKILKDFAGVKALRKRQRLLANQFYSQSLLHQLLALWFE